MGCAKWGYRRASLRVGHGGGKAPGPENHKVLACGRKRWATIAATCKELARNYRTWRTVQAQKLRKLTLAVVRITFSLKKSVAHVAASGYVHVRGSRWRAAIGELNVGRNACDYGDHLLYHCLCYRARPCPLGAISIHSCRCATPSAFVGVGTHLFDRAGICRVRVANSNSFFALASFARRQLPRRGGMVVRSVCRVFHSRRDFRGNGEQATVMNSRTPNESLNALGSYLVIVICHLKACRNNGVEESHVTAPAGFQIRPAMPRPRCHIRRERPNEQTEHQPGGRGPRVLTFRPG